MSKAASASSSGGGFVARLIGPTRAQREGAAARIAELEADVRFWRNLAFLMPYAVKVPPPRIPEPRQPLAPERPAYRPRAGRPVDLWPVLRPNRFPDRHPGGRA